MPSQTALEHAARVVVASTEQLLLAPDDSVRAYVLGHESLSSLEAIRSEVAKMLDAAERRGAAAWPSNEDAEVIVWHRKRVAALEAELATEIERTKQLEAGIATEREANKNLGAALDAMKKLLEEERGFAALQGKALAGWQLRHEQSTTGRLAELTRGLLALRKKSESR